MSLYLLICLDSLLIKAEKESFHHNLLKINKGNIMAQLNDTMVNGDLRVTGTIHGNATSATQDGNGNNIVNTYATKDELSEITSGTLPISKGGTGATTALAAEYALHTKTNTHLTADLADDFRIAFLATAPSASNGVFAGYRKASQFWAYIQGKISSVLGLTSTSYGGKAASATSADSATKATQDGSGNNIVNTYATKEALNSANQNIAGLTSGVNSKLNKDGSNADSTTTYNVLNAAAGGGSDEYSISDDEEIVLTYPTGYTAYKRTLAKFAEWIEDKVMPIINRKLNAWLGNEQEVVFDNVKVRQGVSSSEVEVATYYGIAQSYYDKTYIDKEYYDKTYIDKEISGLKQVNSYTNAIESTATGQTFLQLFKETRSSDTTRLYADVDVCLYGAGYSNDFKLLIAIARNSSGNIAKCRITIIRVTTNTITIRVRKDSSGLMSIVWENAPSYSGLDVRVSINSCISSYWLTPSLQFATSGSNFGSILSSNDYSHYSNSIQTVAFLSDIPDN